MLPRPSNAGATLKCCPCPVKHSLAPSAARPWGSGALSWPRVWESHLKPQRPCTPATHRMRFSGILSTRGDFRAALVLLCYCSAARRGTPEREMRSHHLGVFLDLCRGPISSPFPADSTLSLLFSHDTFPILHLLFSCVLFCFIPWPDYKCSCQTSFSLRLSGGSSDHRQLPLCTREPLPVAKGLLSIISSSRASCSGED